MRWNINYLRRGTTCRRVLQSRNPPLQPTTGTTRTRSTPSKLSQRSERSFFAPPARRKKSSGLELSARLLLDAPGQAPRLVPRRPRTLRLCHQALPPARSSGSKENRGDSVGVPRRQYPKKAPWTGVLKYGVPCSTFSLAPPLPQSCLPCTSWTGQQQLIIWRFV
jgi:hypothetical protein